MNNKEINLSKRMKAVVDMVPPHSCNIADVGCDHAYVSIYLKKEKNVDKVIVMDVREGPLDIARKNILEYGLVDSIDVRLSDGFNKLSPGEADVIIVAGMGGLLIKDILMRGIDVLKTGVPPVLILQPQSDIDEVRIFLYSISYHIEHETMVKEDGKYYTVIRAVYGKELCYRDKEDIVYGRCNILNKDSILIEYLENEERVLKDILSGLNKINDYVPGDNDDNSTKIVRKKQRIEEIKEKLCINRKAYERCVRDEM